MFWRRYTLLLMAACLLVAVSTAGCKAKGKEEAVVATVNGEPILFSRYWQEFRNRCQELGANASPQQGVMLSLKREVLTDLIRETLLLQEARKRNLSVPAETLDARVTEMRQGYDGKAFQKTMLTHPEGYEAWRGAVRNNLLLEALYREVVRAADSVSEEEIRQTYQKNPQAFEVPETVRLRQIVLSDRPQAEALYRRIKKGEDFSQLAGRYSTSPEKENPDEVGVFHKGELPEALEEAAFSALPGTVTPPVSTEYGFHLLRVEGRSPAHLASLEEARSRIADRLRRDKQEAFYARWIVALIRNSDIRVNEAFRETLETKDEQTLIPFTQEGDHADPEAPRTRDRR
jgi:parvulin-like peptidyl-prolyl isomerase